MTRVDRRKVNIPGTYAIRRSGKDRRNRGRRRLNIAVSLIGIMFTFVPMLLIGILIKLTSKGPVIYTQTRVGRNNKLFKIYKFRTMRHEKVKQTWASTNDNRITNIGKFLRKTRLDELPQLFNVLIGDMNVVGPRPEQPRLFIELRKTIEGYEHRQSVLPGITGHAQVTLPYDSCIEDVKTKLEADISYIQSESIGQDVRIMLKTPSIMFGRKNYAK